MERKKQILLTMENGFFEYSIGQLWIVQPQVDNLGLHMKEHNHI
jgi:hypothetical protein